MLKTTQLILVFGLSAITWAQDTNPYRRIVHSTLKGHFYRKPSSPSNGITYHGGPVMLGTTNIYYIWYGNWANNTAIPILENFANYIGGSNYYRINTTYYDKSNQKVENSVKYRGSSIDNYSRGKNLTDANILQIVQSAISLGSLPKDSNGIYFVLTSADVKETSGFCTSYCGWHTYAKISGTDIKYSFVGNPDQCPSACEAQTTSPNENPGADGMASVIAHELSETVTDPKINAWYDNRGQENADKCAWTFGSYFKETNGSYANVSLGSRDYLLQRNWVNASGGKCALSY